MKKTFLTLLIFLSFTGIAYAARKTVYIKGAMTTYQTPSNYGTLGGVGEATSTSGLVGYWPFDGKYMTWSSATVGTSTDASGNGNNGTLVGFNIATGTVQGNMGQALKFNGTNQKINLTSDPIGTSTNVTICGWIKTVNANNRSAMVGNSKFRFGLYASNSRLELSNNSTQIFSLQNSISANVWEDICAVRSASTTGIIYINGIQNTSGSLDSPVAGTGIAIGYSSQDGYFNGSIDDVRIYKRVLSATEVKQLYQLGSTTIIK